MIYALNSNGEQRTERAHKKWKGEKWDSANIVEDELRLKLIARLHIHKWEYKTVIVSKPYTKSTQPVYINKLHIVRLSTSFEMRKMERMKHRIHAR